VEISIEISSAREQQRNKQRRCARGNQQHLLVDGARDKYWLGCFCMGLKGKRNATKKKKDQEPKAKWAKKDASALT